MYMKFHIITLNQKNKITFDYLIHIDETSPKIDLFRSFIFLKQSYHLAKTIIYKIAVYCTYDNVALILKEKFKNI